MEAVVGAVVFMGWLLVLNWVIGALFRWIPELARRRGRRGGGGTRRHRPHPRPHGTPTGKPGPSGRARPARPSVVAD